MAHVSDIKLIRTDTTLDLSQKAEKGMNFKDISGVFYSSVWGSLSRHFRCGIAKSLQSEVTLLCDGNVTPRNTNSGRTYNPEKKPKNILTKL